MSKKTVEIIIDSGNEYLIGVKKNQPILYKQIQVSMADRNNWSSHYTSVEQNKGRTERRTVIVSNQISSINKHWKGLQQIVAVEREVKRNRKITRYTAYFISSQCSNAFYYTEGIRSHWQIENSLHWVKDVTYKEDASTIKKGNAPQNLSTLKNISINIFRKNNYTNLAQAMRMMANKIDKLLNLII